MASVDWKKIHGTGEAAAKKAHFDGSLRGIVDHENEHIDKALSCQNYIIGADSYASAVASLDARTRAVDAVLPPQRVRKDRVTGFSLYTVCPEDIQKTGKEDEYFRKVHGMFCRIFGSENVHGSFIHKDEQHAYLDARTGEERTSLFHAHTVVSAFVPGKGINGKLACTRSAMKKVNREMETICREYGVEWHTGTGKESRTMDELKAASARMERRRQEELILKREELEEIPQRKAMFSRDDVIVKQDDLERIRETAALARPALEKAEEIQTERDKLQGELDAERRRAPDILAAAEMEAERIRKEAEAKVRQIRKKAEEEICHLREQEEELRATTRQLDELLEEQRTALDSPDHNIMKLHRIITEIAEQDARDAQSMRVDRLRITRPIISDLLDAARRAWREIVPAEYRTPELEERKLNREQRRRARG